MQAGRQQQQVRIVQQCLIHLPIVTVAPAQITFATSPNETRLVEVDETITFTATLTGGNVGSQPLEFTTTAGTVNPPSGRTNADGKITGTLTLNQLGTVTVTTQLVGGRIQGDPLVVTAVQPQLSFVNPPTSVETEAATPLTLKLELAASGQSRPLASRPISLTVSGGDITPNDVTTDPDGQATVTYTAPATTGTVTITARSGAASKEQPIMVDVPPPLATATIIAPNPAQLNAVAQDQPITIALRDPQGNPIRNRLVTLETNFSTFSNGAQSIAINTDANGQATATLRGIAQLGAATISVREGPTTVVATPVLQSVPAACRDIEPDNNSVRSGGLPPRLGWLNGICNGRIDASDPADNSDFYSVELSAGTAITVRLTNIPPNTNYNTFLFAQEVELRPSTALIGSSRPGNQDEEFTFVVPRTERYYIRVFAVTRAAPGAPDGYTLTVRTQ